MLGLVGQIKNAGQVPAIVKNIKAKLEASHVVTNQEREKAKTLATKLISNAEGKMRALADDLKTQLGNLIPNFNPCATSALDGDSKDFYFRNQIITTARGYDYFANLSSYKGWSRLILPGKNQANILISAHGLGSVYRGVIAISACYFSRNETDDTYEIGDVTTLGKEYFQLNYADDLKAVQERFSIWLNDVLAEGLAVWNNNSLEA